MWPGTKNCTGVSCEIGKDWADSGLLVKECCELNKNFVPMLIPTSERDAFFASALQCRARAMLLRVEYFEYRGMQ